MKGNCDGGEPELLVRLRNEASDETAADEVAFQREVEVESEKYYLKCLEAIKKALRCHYSTASVNVGFYWGHKPASVRDLRRCKSIIEKVCDRLTAEGIPARLWRRESGPDFSLNGDPTSMGATTYDIHMRW